jgi:outer membrane murein-binding lipoprotein Lpp
LSRGAVVAVLCAVVALAGCQEDEKRPPAVEDVDTISASVARIVFHCRSVEQGFLAGVDERALRRPLDQLEEAAEEVDPDASFRLPESTLERETTLRDQVDLAARTLQDECSPEDAERLREALGD